MSPESEVAAGAPVGSGCAFVGVATEPAFFWAAGVVAVFGCDIFFELSSVTMMSPCWAAAALSSMFFSASDHVWPTALQLHYLSNALRYFNAFGDC